MATSLLSSRLLACSARMASAGRIPALACTKGSYPWMTAGWKLPQAKLSQSVFASYGARQFSTEDLTTMRNIGISAHIDSGKTTLTERILFYTGRLQKIHDVRGKDGVGAKMDSMDLERERGITIQSAATYCRWDDHSFNIIDTPGHVDFTIEVERALRVLDGAILVLCSVGGVQSQSITVDRQMKRYSVPRIAFINKLDRQGANPEKVIADLRGKLGLNAAALQIPIGLENEHVGVVDVIEKRARYFEGDFGEVVESKEVPADLVEKMEETRATLIEYLAEVDEEIEEIFLMEEEPDEKQIHDAIRRQTIANKFVPVFMGAAFKNKGVQPALDGVVRYLPDPTEVPNYAMPIDAAQTAVGASSEEKIPIEVDSTKPLVALAFKLEDGRFGQLTYMRIYQGTLNRGDTVFNSTSGKQIKVPRTVRMNSDEMEEIQSAGAGEIVAMFGVDCASGDTFTDGTHKVSMESMHVPDPVMSVAANPKTSKDETKFMKAVNRFTKEDPTFRCHTDPDSGETILSGMGELHMQIYLERMSREFGVDVETGPPRVNYRETITSSGKFDYLHKKQTGGAGQYGKVIGYIEPLEEDFEGEFDFKNKMIGNNIPPEYIDSVRKGFLEAVTKGSQIGHPVDGVRVVLEDGVTHAVDSSEMAFRAAARGAFRQAFESAQPTVLEPIMQVEISAPAEFQGAVLGALNQKNGVINGTEASGDYVNIFCHIPLRGMFGYSSGLRSITQGKGEFSMEYLTHQPVQPQLLAELKKNYEQERLAAQK